MTEPEVPATAVPVENVERATATPETAAPGAADDEGLIERLRNIDPRDHKTALLTVGAAAVALGVGVYALSKKRGGGEIFIAFGDRRDEKEGVISIGERKVRGIAASFPVSERVLAHLPGRKKIFGMSGDGFTYPLDNAEDVAEHAPLVEKVAGHLVDVLKSRGKNRSEA